MGIEVIVSKAAWIVVFISCLLAVAELVATNRFSAWPYSIGVRVLRFRIGLELSANNIKNEFDFKSSKARLITNNKLFFRQKLKFSGFKLYTPFPLKGVIFTDNGQTFVEGRVPLFVSVFIAAWLVGWSADVVVNSPGGGDLLHLISGWLFAGILIAIAIRVEIQRARDTAYEIEAYINKRI